MESSDYIYGLRAIIESALLNTMFDLPGQKDVRRCVITKGVITSGEKPRLERAPLRDAPVRRTQTKKPAKEASLPEEPSAS